MRSSPTWFAVLALTACANSSTTPPPYDEVAQIIGAQLASPGGGGELAALGDATAIARGGPPVVEIRNFEGVLTTEHDGLAYAYYVRCFDAADKPITCGGRTAWADIGAFWGGSLHTPRFDAAVFHHATWRLDWMSDEWAVALGTSWSTYDVTFGAEAGYFVTTTSDTQVVRDTKQLALRGGNQLATLDVVERFGDAADDSFALPVSVRFDVPGHAWIELGDRSYALDVVTGDVSLGTILE